MQLRRAMEIVNILSVDNNIGTAYVETLQGDSRFEVDLEQLSEVEK